MDYAQAVAWLYARQALGIKLGLAKMDRLLQALGDPQQGLRAVHVAGTNGKGGVVACLESILRHAGFKVGTTTSPHLVAFQERITLDGSHVTKELVVRGVEAMQPHVDALDAQGEAPTFFECVTALALWCFAQAGMQIVVVETGMGGRLDATNILLPEVCVITDIGLDHQEHLGKSLVEIAWEKAGIMKPRTPLVTAASGEALLLLKARSHEMQAPMSVLGEDYQVQWDAKTTSMDLHSPHGVASYRLGIPGRFQARNAALAVAAADALQARGVHIPPRAVQTGLRDVRHPGRLERIDAHGAHILIDGCHNVPAAHALARHLEDLGWDQAVFVFGACADKPWQQILSDWLPHATGIHATPIRNPRALAPQAVLAWAREHAPALPVHVHTDASAAILAAAAQARSQGHGRVVIAGSLFLAGEARAVLLGLPLEEIRGRQ